MAQEYSLYAKAMCKNGFLGELSSIVIHHKKEDITHLVIKDETISKSQAWLVPVDFVASSTSKVLQLDFTRDDKRRLQPFIYEHYVEREYNGYFYAFNLPIITAPKWLPSETPGQKNTQFSLHRSMKVTAADGVIGNAGEFFIDPHSKRISHIILKRGHLWEKKDVIIPVSLIGKIENDKIHLKLEIGMVKKLTHKPFKRPWKEIDPSDLDLMIWIFSTKDQAYAALRTMKAYQLNNRIISINVAVISLDLNGNISLREITEVNSPVATSNSLVNGGMVNFLFGTDGHLTISEQNTHTTTENEEQIDNKLSNSLLINIKKYLPYGSSAIMLIIEHRWYSVFRQALARFDHTFIHRRLTEIDEENGNFSKLDWSN